MRFAVFTLGLVVSCAAAVAPAQSTRPAAEDPYQDLPMPARRTGPATQSAAGANASNGTTGASGTMGDPFETKRLAVALAIVIAAIFVSHRVWKRLGMPGAGGRSTGALQVVSRLSVSPKQQLLLVRVGRRLVLIGNNGTQMSPLCEIADPEEAAGLLGQVAVERDGSVSSSFGAVLGGEEKRFAEETDAAAAAAQEQPEEDAAMATTREELSGMMDKVRDLSKQFRRA